MSVSDDIASELTWALSVIADIAIGERVMEIKESILNMDDPMTAMLVNQYIELRKQEVSLKAQGNDLSARLKEISIDANRIERTLSAITYLMASFPPYLQDYEVDKAIDDIMRDRQGDLSVKDTDGNPGVE